MRASGKRAIVVAIAAIVVVGITTFVVATRGPEMEPRAALAETKDPNPGSTPSLGPSEETPSPSVGDPEGPKGASGPHPRLENLTSGSVYKSGVGTSFETSSVTIPSDSLVLVHLMSCCDHAAVPRVEGPGLRFDLAVTHETGEKRHWVFIAANTGNGSDGSVRFSFEVPQDRVLWIVDAATGAELGGNGADAIAQTVWQDSQPNATTGEIALAPFEDPDRNLGVAFAAAGSGTAVDIRPDGGAIETAEAEVAGSSLLIDTFWTVGDGRALAATFLDEAGTPAVQSWLFLALELRAA